jgi:hypothetical protein
LPWSMCAMMQKFRISAGSVRDGCGTLGGSEGNEVNPFDWWEPAPWSHEAPSFSE